MQSVGAYPVSGLPRASRLPAQSRTEAARGKGLRARSSGRRLALARLLRGAVVVALAACCALTVKFGLPVAHAARSFDALAVRAGLGVDQIAVVGFRNTLSEDILSALNADASISILTYDTMAAKARLETLPWIESAEVSRSLPDGLDVSIRERRPFAVWQHKQLMFLIDAEGRTLEPTSRGEHRNLPLVVGDGAEMAAGELLKILSGHPAILGRLEAAIFVGGRRWDLQLKDAPRLLLPEQDARHALDWADRMQQDERLFDRRVAVIDLRVTGRVAFQIAPDAVVRKPESRRPVLLNRGA